MPFTFSMNLPPFVSILDTATVAKKSQPDTNAWIFYSMSWKLITFLVDARRFR